MLEPAGITQPPTSTSLSARRPIAHTGGDLLFQTRSDSRSRKARDAVKLPRGLDEALLSHDAHRPRTPVGPTAAPRGPGSRLDRSGGELPPFAALERFPHSGLTPEARRQYRATACSGRRFDAGWVGRIGSIPYAGEPRPCSLSRGPRSSGTTSRCGTSCHGTSRAAKGRGSGTTTVGSSSTSSWGSAPRSSGTIIRSFAKRCSSTPARRSSRHSSIATRSRSRSCSRRCFRARSVSFSARTAPTPVRARRASRAPRRVGTSSCATASTDGTTGSPLTWASSRAWCPASLATRSSSRSTTSRRWRRSPTSIRMISPPS